MKKSLELVIYFLSFIVGSFLIGNFVYMQYMASTNLVAGQSFVIPKALFLYGFFETIPVVLVQVIPFLLIYKVRHLNNPVSTAIIYVVLCLLTWFVLFPFFEFGKDYLYNRNTTTPSEMVDNSELSGGYFRHVGDKFYYFIKDSDTPDVILMHDSSKPEEFGEKNTLSLAPYEEYKMCTGDYKDSLVKESVTGSPELLINCVSILKNYASNSWRNGYISWLCFCSLGFALASSYSLIKISFWRLVNILYILITNIAILAINIFYFVDRLYPVRNVLSRLVYGDNFLRFQYFQERFIQLPLFFINLIYGILVLVLGLIITAVKHKNR